MHPYLLEEALSLAAPEQHHHLKTRNVEPKAK